jgi:hypothetical protein
MSSKTINVGELSDDELLRSVEKAAREADPVPDSVIYDAKAAGQNLGRGLHPLVGNVDLEVGPAQ